MSRAAINHGGFAFPCEVLTDYRDTEPTKFPGMTLRDWFAGQALAGYLADTRCPDRATPDIVAGWCYQNADAMIAARKGGAK